MTRKIEILPYNPAWPQMFEEEAAKIKQSLGENCIAIHHIGSTAVPGLCAKPKIDIILSVKTMHSLIRDLEKLAYEYRGEFNIPLHLGFRKRPPLPNINLHVFEEGNPEIELNLLFRDFLRNHPDARQAYANLKLSLVEQESSHQKTKATVSTFNLGKDAFIKKILDQAGFKGLRMMICTHHDEWEAARTFRNRTFFDKIPIADPYTWTFDHQDHTHLVLYQGTNIIGYAHTQLWPEQRAALRIIVINESLRGQGLGGHFLSLCERWLKGKGFKALHTQASPDAYPFYLKYGYTEMPFNDPNGHESDPQDTDMGKVL
ncbi:MAG: GNAT family N-acetyltransferase [Alphaproteobacteria bacterium]|nr:GNAT family N-acetyltransferase [Alphaproteobacteria bacterium]